MRVEQYNGYAMSRIFSNTRKIGNVSLPDFNDFHFITRSTPVMSDAEFKVTIIEQAKKDHAAGKFQTDSPAYKNLMKSYVSVASPDRKGFITEALTKISKNNPTKTYSVNYLKLLLGKVTYEKGAKGLSYAEFENNNGELVASYSNGGWTFYGTKEENARTSDFLSIYNEAWYSAEKSAG